MKQMRFMLEIGLETLLDADPDWNYVCRFVEDAIRELSGFSAALRVLGRYPV